jgi:hypothetical protein
MGSSRKERRRHRSNCAWKDGRTAALLDIGATGRRGVELPKVKSTYWPHAVVHQRAPV